MSAPVAAENPNRRALIILGVGAGLAATFFIGSKVLAGGGGSGSSSSGTSNGSTSAPLSQAVTPPSTVAPAAAAPAPGTPAPVETFQVFNTKNPFQPLRTLNAPASAAKPVATAAPVAATPAPTPLAASPTPVAATPTAAPTATAPVAAAPVMRVALLDVFMDGGRVVANVRVNDTVSKVGAGDTFASSFKVVSLDAATKCGAFLYVEDQFQLCKGEEALK